MKRFNTAEDVLEQVFTSCVTLRQDPIILGRCDFLSIPGQNGPRWIVPVYARFGKIVLQQWQPYNFSSKLKWKGIRWLYNLGLLDKLPGITSITTSSKLNIKTNSRDSYFVPIVYVGTPGLEQKAVATLVSQKSGTPEKILKVALTEKAKKSLLHESRILEKLSELNISDVPTLYGIDKSGKCTCQSVIGGRLSSRTLTQAHIDRLIQFPKSPKITSLDKQQNLLRLAFKKEYTLFESHTSIISKALPLIHGKNIPFILVHGDFAPWNLKTDKDGRITPIDWEAAQLEGFPFGIYVIFFLYRGICLRGSTRYKK